jgi:hypothetical protein
VVDEVDTSDDGEEHSTGEERTVLENVGESIERSSKGIDCSD